MLQNGQMTDVGENVGQLSVKLSLELNMIETNRFFSAERRGPWDRVGHKNDRRELGNVKKGSIPRRFPTIFKYGKAILGSLPPLACLFRETVWCHLCTNHESGLWVLLVSLLCTPLKQPCLSAKPTLWSNSKEMSPLEWYIKEDVPLVASGEASYHACSNMLSTSGILLWVCMTTVTISYHKSWYILEFACYSRMHLTA